MKEAMKTEASALIAEMRKRSVTGTGITLSAGSNGLLVAAFDAMQAKIEAARNANSYLRECHSNWSADAIRWKEKCASLHAEVVDLKCALAVRSQLEAHKWISVEDRLPENQINVLIFVVTDYKLQGSIVARYIPSLTEPYEGECSEFGEYDEETDTTYCPAGWYAETAYIGDEYSSYFVDDKVTHWLPLPEPPNAIKTLWAVNIPEEPDSEELLFAATSKEHAQSIVSRLHNEIFETYPTLGEPIADSIYVTEWQDSAEAHAESLATKWWEHTTFLECE